MIYIRCRPNNWCEIDVKYTKEKRYTNISIFHSSPFLSISFSHPPVHTSHAQPPLPLSLPAKIVVPPPWHALPLLQADLGSLFSNSSPFAFSQSLLMVPPAGEASKAGVRASFGPYSVSQVNQLGLSSLTISRMLQISAYTFWELVP